MQHVTVHRSEVIAASRACRARTRTLICGLTLAASSLIAPVPSQAQMPTPVGSAASASHKQSGLAVQIQGWASQESQGGYFPVYIDVTNSRGPRRLKLVVEHQFYANPTEISRTIDVDRNSRVRVPLSIPVISHYYSIQLKVYEFGREIEALRCGTGASYTGMTAAPHVLFASVADGTFFDASMRAISGGNYTQQRAIVVPPPDLPTRWIDYTTIDLIVLSLRELEAASAESRAAIARWAMAGGSLVVYGVGADRENSPTLSRLLDLDRRAPFQKAWRKPDLKDRNADRIEIEKNTRVSRRRGPVFYQESVATPPVAVPTPSDEKFDGEAHFSIRQFGMGQLIAITAENPFPGSLLSWAWVLKSLGPGATSWTFRHGVAPRDGHADFWEFIVPGVGRVPVGMFQISIVVFAVFIGPLNYVVLRRRQQLHIFALTVPILAALATIGLVGYAAVADGFAVRVRARSVTLLDQTRGEAVSWSRLSYYAGLAPSRGLHFSPDTAVYPIEPEGVMQGRRRLDWTSDQHLSSGWLHSRTPTQFLTVAHRQADERLQVVIEAAGSVRVKNDLGVAVRYLVVSDEKSDLHVGGPLELGARATLKKAATDAATEPLRKLIAQQKLVVPAELNDTDYELFYSNRRYYPYSEGDASWTNNLLEQRLRELIRPDRTMPSRSFVAAVSEAPQIEFGTRPVENTDSLYIIIGSY